MKLHHTQQKFITANSVTLTEDQGTYTAAANGQTFTGTSVKAVLAQVAQAIKPKATRKPKSAKRARKASDEEDEDEDGEGKGSVVKAKYKKLYHPHHDTNGDDFAKAFGAAVRNEDDEVDVELMREVAKANGLSITAWTHLRNKDGGVNVGMIRMNLGNKLRGMQRNGTDVKIGERTFKGSKVEKKAKKAKA